MIPRITAILLLAYAAAPCIAAEPKLAQELIEFRWLIGTWKGAEAHIHKEWAEMLAKIEAHVAEKKLNARDNKELTKQMFEAEILAAIEAHMAEKKLNARDNKELTKQMLEHVLFMMEYIKKLTATIQRDGNVIQFDYAIPRDAKRDLMHLREFLVLEENELRLYAASPGAGYKGRESPPMAGFHPKAGYLVVTKLAEGSYRLSQRIKGGGLNRGRAVTKIDARTFSYGPSLVFKKLE